MAQNRMHFKDTVHFITNRCEHEMFLMLPNDSITKIIQGWFARAHCLFGHGLEIYGFIFLSNHFHLICNDTQGTLAAFMCYFQGNVAKAGLELARRRAHQWKISFRDAEQDQAPQCHQTRTKGR